MLLCIDIGNTHIVIGVYKGDNLLSSFRMKTDSYITEDEYGIKIHYLLKSIGVNISDITGAICSSVVPALDKTFKKMINKYLKIEPIFVGPGIKSGINIKIDDPRQLGADLLVGGVAAVEKYGAPVVVIDLGTATTISAVNENKEFLGGIIYPGIITSYASLIKSTSKLEEVSFHKPNNIIGKNTVESIRSGMFYGTASMVEGVITRIKTEIDNPNIIITGGMAPSIIPLINTEAIYDENLILDGLKILYYKNK